MDSFHVDYLVQLDKAAIDAAQDFNYDGRTFVGRLIDIIDGDTLDVIMNTQASVYHKYRIRLVDIDVCEISGSLQHQSKQIRTWVLEFLMGGHTAAPPAPASQALERKNIRDLLVQTPCIVAVMCRRFDKYGRVLADVQRRCDGASVSEYLLSHGFAKPYSGGTKPTHSKENM